MIYAYLIYIAIILLFLYKITTWNHNYFEKRNIKYIKPLPFVGNYGPFIAGKHLIVLMIRLYNRFPNERYVGFFHYFVPRIWIRDNQLIKQMTVKDYDAFLDHDHHFLEENDPLFTNTLVCLKGKRWKQMRMIMSPAFTSSKLKAMHPFIKDCCDQVTSYIDQEMEANTNGDMVELNLKDMFSRFANDVIATVAFGVKVDSFAERNNTFYLMSSKLLHVDLRFILIYIFNSLFPRLAVFLGLTIIDKKVANFFKDIVVNTIKDREEKGTRRSDLIDLLIDAKNGCLKGEETKATLEDNDNLKYEHTAKETWTDDEITAQSLIFFVAGYETISSVLTFTFYELAKNPDMQIKIQEEIDQVPEEGNIYDNIMNMTFLDMFVSEILRLHPSLFGTDRICSRPYTLPPPNPESKVGYTFEAGEAIAIQIRSIMRDPNYFPDPERFDPERFSEENKRNIKPCTYIPFGVGPRQCIGKRFSLMEIKSVIFFMLSRFDVVIGPKTIDPYKRKTKPLTLVPNEGIFIGFKRRYA